MARVLILRAAAEAGRTAEAVRERGHTPLLLPLQEIVALSAPLPQDSFRGFVVTSGNAVAPLAAAFAGDPRPVLAVGATTAERLREAGFANVVAGAGSGASLAAEAAALAGQGGLLYAAGRVRTDGLEAGLAESGVRVAVWEVYDTVRRDPAPAEIEAVFAEGMPDAVLLLSIGQALAYVRFVARAALSFQSRPLCLSRRIFDMLPGELRGGAEISDRLSLSALLDLVR